MLVEHKHITVKTGLIFCGNHNFKLPNQPQNHLTI
jgi:hypothetical protein